MLSQFHWILRTATRNLRRLQELNIVAHILVDFLQCLWKFVTQNLQSVMKCFFLGVTTQLVAASAQRLVNPWIYTINASDTTLNDLKTWLTTTASGAVNAITRM
jgi:fructose-specific phosphotransferase system IIC component